MYDKQWHINMAVFCWYGHIVAVGGVGQAHVHKNHNYSKVGGWNLANRSVLAWIDPQVKIIMEDKCSVSVLNCLRNAINDLAVM